MSNKEYFDLLSPFEKTEVDSLYFLFIVQEEDTDIVKKRLGGHYSDDDYGSLNRHISIDFRNKVVAKHLITKTRWSTYHTYISISDNKEINVHEDEILHSEYYEDTFIHSYPQREYYGLPISFRDYVKFRLGIDIKGTTIRLSEARRLLKQINKMDKNKEPIELSFDRMEAAMQLKEFFGMNTNTIYDDDEVFEKIKQINQLASQYLGTQNLIKEKIEQAIAKYKKSLEELKPSYKNINLGINLKLEKALPKDQLILDLNAIIISLSTKITLMKTLDELFELKSILNKEEVKGNETELKDIAKSIRENVEYLPNKNEILIEANIIVSKEIKRIQDSLYDQLETLNTSNLELYDTTQSTFKRDLKELKDRIKSHTKKIKPFVSLIKIFESDNTEYKGMDTLEDFISTLNYVIVNLQDSTTNTRLKDSWIEIKKKYLNIIETIIKNYSEISKETFSELEIQFRKEITPLLEQLDIIQNKHINQLISADSFIYQIDRSIDYIKGKITDENFNKEPITSLVKDIIDSIDRSIDDKNKNDIIADILIKLEENKLKLKKAKIDNYDDYNIIRNNILRDLYRIIYKTEKFDDNLELYNENNIFKK